MRINVILNKTSHPLMGKFALLGKQSLLHHKGAWLLIRLTFLSLVLMLALRPIQASGNWSWYQVDTHVHSSVSADAFVDVGIISQSALESGYNAIFLTDHNAASNFQINQIPANHNYFDDTFDRWE